MTERWDPELPAIDGRYPQRQRLANVLNDPEIWRLGELLPRAPKQLGGATRIHPGWMIILYDTLIHIFGTAVDVERELSDPVNWRMIQAAARERYPNNPEFWVPDEPMKRHHYAYVKGAYLTKRPFLDAAGAVHREEAAKLAVDLGLCVPEAGASWTHIERENVVCGDGKVVKARTRKPRVDRVTGEIRPRSEPDIETYVVGGGERTQGVGFVFLSTRGDDVNRRVILDVIDAPKKGGEATHAMDAFERTLPELPGAQAALYDGALRGTHRKRIFRQGKIPISPGRNPDNPKKRERHLGAATVRRPDGAEEVVQLQVIDEFPHIKELAEDGTPLYTRLTRVKTTPPVGPRGRTYCEYVVPSENGGGIVRLRATSDAEDEAIDFKREEWLHPYALGDPDYDRLMPKRNDAESGNNTLDNSMWRERAHSIGRPGILFNLITWSAYQNAQARALYAERAGPMDSAAA